MNAQRAPRFTRPQSHIHRSIVVSENEQLMPTINSPLEGYVISRDQPGAHPLIGSDLMSEVGKKPSRQTQEGVGLYDRPRGNNSDGIMQSWFTKLAGVKKPAYYDFTEVEQRVDDELPSRELIIGRFVVEYINRGKKNHASELSADQIAQALGSGIDTRRFDKALSKAGTNLNTVTSIFRGSGPRIIKDPNKDSWVPFAVQERVQILPATLRDRMVKNKAKDLQLKRVHGRAEKSSQSQAITPRQTGLRQDFFDKRAASRRVSARGRAHHHVHAAEEKMKKIAFRPSRKLEREAIKLTKGAQPKQAKPRAAVRPRGTTSKLNPDDRARIAREAAQRR